MLAWIQRIAVVLCVALAGCAIEPNPSPGTLAGAFDAGGAGTDAAAAVDVTASEDTTAEKDAATPVDASDACTVDASPACDATEADLAPVR